MPLHFQINILSQLLALSSGQPGLSRFLCITRFKFFIHFTECQYRIPLPPFMCIQQTHRNKGLGQQEQYNCSSCHPRPWKDVPSKESGCLVHCPSPTELSNSEWAKTYLRGCFSFVASAQIKPREPANSSESIIVQPATFQPAFPFPCLFRGCSHLSQAVLLNSSSWCQ